MSSLPGRSSNSDSLHYAQKAPLYLKSLSPSGNYPLASVLSAPESLDQWIDLERLFVACLKTGDEESAHSCLERLIERFGASNERIMGLRGLYQETIASDDQGLQKVLAEYEGILADNPVNIPLAKRRVVILRLLSRTDDAVQVLSSILDVSPTDAEAWADLSDCYFSIGSLPQAIYCLEEVLLITPNAWNVHARIGEVLYISAVSNGPQGTNEINRLLSQSIERFCRSIELCSQYIRGYCGLKLATDRLLAILANSKQLNQGGEIFEFQEISDLNQKSKDALHLLTRKGDTELDEAEIIAAKAVLKQERTGVSSA